MKDNEIEQDRIRIFKFINGDTMIAYQEDFDADKGVVYVQVPFKVVHTWSDDTQGIQYMLVEWMEYGASNTTYQIPVGSIITVAEPSPMGREHYMNALASFAIDRVQEDKVYKERDSDTEDDSDPSTANDNVVTFKPKTMH